MALNLSVVGVGQGGLSVADQGSREKILRIKFFDVSGLAGRFAGSFELLGQIVDFRLHHFFSSGPRVNKDRESQQFSGITATGLAEEK